MMQKQIGRWEEDWEFDGDGDWHLCRSTGA